MLYKPIWSIVMYYMEMSYEYEQLEQRNKFYEFGFNMEQALLQVSDFLFYFVLFKMKKIEISLNPSLETSDEVINKLLKFIWFVRCSVYFCIFGLIFKITCTFYFFLKEYDEIDEKISSDERT